MTKLNLAAALSACLVIIAGAVAVRPAHAQQNVLQGGVNQTDILRSNGSSNTSLNRNEVRRGSGDSFAQPRNQAPALEQAFAPGNFNVASIAPPPPPAFNLNANSQGQSADFQGQQGVPMMEQAPVQSAPYNLAAQQQMQPPAQMSDPDSSPEMKLLWDAWHRRVAEAIFIRYQSLANAAFSHSPPIAAVAAYTVTRDGKISNVHLVQKSPNAMYNGIVMMAVQSLNGNTAILQFPADSRRMTVDKQGQFTQNYGPVGFKNVIGDQETIRR